MVVYVSEQGALVSKKRGLIVVSKMGKVLQKIHLLGLEQLVLFGKIQISTQALHALLANGTDAVLLNMAGRFLGRLSSGTSKNISLRRRQFQKLEQPEEIIALCKSYVQGKLNNCLNIIRRHNRTLQDEQVSREAVSIRYCLEDLQKAQTADKVRGFEGAGSARYFSALKKIFRAPGMTFFRRARRPPPDPINILLSLGYTLLTNQVHSMCEAAGLDPYLGALHTPRYGRPSLALDLIEEFRPVIVDTAAIRAVNTRALSGNDFIRVIEEETDAEESFWKKDENKTSEKEDIIDQFDEPFDEDKEEPAPPIELRPVLITSLGLKKWLLAFERRLEEQVFYSGTGNRLSYRQVLRQQVYCLARHLKGEAEYKPFISRA